MDTIIAYIEEAQGDMGTPVGSGSAESPVRAKVQSAQTLMLH